MTKKIIILILPLLALACSLSRSALLVPFPIERPPFPTAEATQNSPQMTYTSVLTPACTVTAGNLHLRASPGVSAQVVAYLHAGDVLIVLGILVFGVGTFGRGGDFNRRHANRIMRMRIVAQAVAVALVLLYVWLRGRGG